MLSKCFEWSRIVDPSPTDETVGRRKTIVTDVLKRLDESKSRSELCNLAIGAVVGFEEGFSNSSDVVSLLIDTTKTHHLAFPSDLSENAADLRVTAAIAIGEFIVRGRSPVFPDAALQTASIILPCIGLRTPHSCRHLQSMLAALGDAARSLLSRTAHAQRVRPHVDFSKIEQLAAVDSVPELLKSHLAELIQSLKQLQKGQAADREEIELLWWFYRRFSTTGNVPWDDLDAFVAATTCGVEACDAAIWPPSESLGQMLVRGVLEGRKSSDSAPISLAKIVERWKAAALLVLTPRSDARAQFVIQHPRAFPLTWLSLRLRDSQWADGWAAEFRTKTGVDPQTKVNAQDLLFQCLRERTAERYLNVG